MRVRGGYFFSESTQFLGCRCRENGAISRRALIDTEAEVFGNERFHAIEKEIVELGAGLASDFDGVFEASGGDESGAGSFALEQRVGADGGAVEKDVVYASQVSQSRRDMGHPTDDLGNCFDDGLGWVGGRRENL